MELFEGGPLEHKVMKKIGFFDYLPAPWDSVKPDLYQRQINYKFDKRIFGYGGEANATQQRSCSVDQNRWVVEETTLLQGLLLSDYFNV